MKRIAAALVAILFVIVPTTAKSLGLGEIDLQSHLNEPLLARIPVRSLGDIEDASVRVAMASREQFERAGIARPFILSSVHPVILSSVHPFILSSV